MKKSKSLLVSPVIMLVALFCTCCSSAIQPTVYYPGSRANIDSVHYRDMGYWREEIVVRKKEQKRETTWPFVTAFVFLGLFVWDDVNPITK